MGGIEEYNPRRNLRSLTFEIEEVLGRSGDIDGQTRTEILDAVRDLRRDMGSAGDETLEQWISSVVRCMGESKVEYGSGLSRASAEDLRRCLEGIRA
jgi:hypothetical protein